MASTRSRLGIVGTGNFAVALATSLAKSGYDVIIGSRKPEERRATLPLPENLKTQVAVERIADCFADCDVIFIAIHAENFLETLGGHANVAGGKLLVDVTNSARCDVTRSNAQLLADILPDAVVVKAFNSVPALAFDQVCSKLIICF